MPKIFKNHNFPHFLRKWSESIRIVLHHIANYLKQTFFLSTFILNAEMPHFFLFIQAIYL